MRRTTIVLAALALWVAASPQAAAQSPPEFEVISVKPAPPDAKFSQTNYDPGGLTAHGVNLKQLIEWAYQVTDAQVSGGPGWIDSKFFDVDAKAKGTHTKEEILSMLQPALADRFKLALRHETKEMQVYVLTQGGPANIQIEGSRQPDAKGVTLIIHGQNVSMRYLCDHLTSVLGRLVVDRTGLQQSFDFKIEIALDESEVTDKRSIMTTAMWDAIPKLGFKLESQKQPVEVLAIDHAEEPSAN
jgi:uncharacterized protein (TIGR03435 family)